MIPSLRTSGTNCFLLCDDSLWERLFRPKIRAFLKSDPFYVTLMRGIGLLINLTGFPTLG